MLLTEATHDAVGEIDGVDFESLGKVRFRNVAEPVHIYLAHVQGTRVGGLPLDPVCRMTVAPELRAGHLLHAGRHYSFCSLKCAAAFASDSIVSSLRRPRREATPNMAVDEARVS